MQIKSPAENNRAETSISSAGSQDTCDLCPNSADSLKYIGSFDSYIIAYPQAFVNTKMQNKKPCWKKNNRAEKSISSAGSQDTQDTCDLCPNTADKLWYIWSFDNYIISHYGLFVNTIPPEKDKISDNPFQAHWEVSGGHGLAVLLQ